MCFEDKDDLVRYLLPYCIQQLKDGSYVALNREYKPVGFTTGDWIIYEEYPIRFTFTKLTDRSIAKFSVHPVSELRNRSCIYLYDGDSPMSPPQKRKAYFQRLKALASLVVKGAGYGDDEHATKPFDRPSDEVDIFS